MKSVNNYDFKVRIKNAAFYILPKSLPLWQLSPISLLTVTVITHLKSSLAFLSVSLYLVWNDSISLGSLWHVLNEFNTVNSHDDVLRCRQMSHDVTHSLFYLISPNRELFFSEIFNHWAAFRSLPNTQKTLWKQEPFTLWKHDPFTLTWILNNETII